MLNGVPFHQAAEQDIDASLNTKDPEDQALLLARAQVHALLAVHETLKGIENTLDAIRDWGTGQTLPKPRPER